MVEAFALPGGCGLGTAPMGGPGWQLDWGPTNRDAAVAAVRAAVSAGIGWIDTAPFYGWAMQRRSSDRPLTGWPSVPLC
jgi:aryl-alcohol dehydrogenase-like predicted oxidoreductase